MQGYLCLGKAFSLIDANIDRIKRRLTEVSGVGIYL